jgi:glycosyltransferase involved in cell wall biosynthesis
MSHLSLIIPIYDEEAYLKRNFETVKGYLDDLRKEYEIVLVDDGSTDSTASIIKDIVRANPQSRSLASPKNRGKGNAVKRGILNAAGEYVIFTDADLAVPVHFIGTCLKKLEAGATFVIASRHLPESSFKVRENFLRRILGEIFRRFSRLSLGLRVSDVTCGLKGLERKAAHDIFSRSKIDRWGYDAEIIFLAQKLGHKIEEFSVDWRHSFDSKVNVGTDSLRTFTEICRVYYYYLSKQYN